MLPSMRLEDKIVMVTGAGSGIGRAVAIAAAEAGAHCVPCELPEKTDDLAGVCAEIERLERRALPVPLRLPDLDSIELAVERAVKEMGRIDVLVNNAGVNIPRVALDVDEADWDGVMDVNLKGLFFMSQRVGRRMVNAGGGKIVNMASQNGVIGYYRRAAYCSSKAGVVNLTRVSGARVGPVRNHRKRRGSHVYPDAPHAVHLRRSGAPGGSVEADPARTGRAARRRRGRRGFPGEPGRGPDHGAYAAGRRRLDGGLVGFDRAGLQETVDTRLEEVWINGFAWHFCGRGHRAGTMGAGIAGMFARTGCRVHLVDLSDALLDRAMARLRLGQEALVEAGLLCSRDADASESRVTTTTDLAEACDGSDFLLEAVTEDLALKQELFSAFDRLCPRDTVLATNTSGLSVTAIAGATGRPDRVGGMHFWNPPHLIPLVEVIRADTTSDETAEHLKAVAIRLNKSRSWCGGTFPGSWGTACSSPWFGRRCICCRKGWLPPRISIRR